MGISHSLEICKYLLGFNQFGAFINFLENMVKKI